ncbi:tetratricopeptide repeat protein [candidate division TA06 bacterium]|uniref:Tetratricopeptide repeat protein n=1 Tax=candidate division TA06 bacterium TaxID=2250710 RepID=A0A933IB48_UNCT6|nr:tetratricopeptide repeat protein [candidate division TA06 bacterium]
MKKYLVLVAVIILAVVSCGPVFVAIRRTEKPRLDIPAIKRVAVVDFVDPYNRNLGPGVGNVLVSKLAEQGYYEMVEREKIQSVMSEHKFNLTGAVDPGTVKQLGGLLGVDAIITGEILAYKVETSKRMEKVERKEGTGRYEEVERKNIFTGKKYKVKEEIMKTVLVDEERTTKSGTVSINYRLIDIASGKVAASKSQSASYNKWFKDNVPGDDQILSGLLTAVTDSFVGDISPHYVNVTKRLLKSKADPSQIGAKYAKAGDWQRAVEIWERSAASLPGDPGLWHNIGVAYEALGSYDKALESYKKASDLDPANEMYIQDQAGVRNAYRRGLAQ